MEYTLAVIKPDAVRHHYMGAILTGMDDDFQIHSLSYRTWMPLFARQFYAEHSGQIFFEDLVKFMCSGPSCAVVLTGPDAVQRWRQAMGATDPAKANPLSIRGRYGSLEGPIMWNAVHGSDSVESAGREIRLCRAEWKHNPLGAGLLL